MSSPAACCLRHLFPFLCLSLAPSLVKIHKLVIPWPLHGYSPAMQIIETPITMTEEGLGRGRRTNLTGQRKGVAVKMCTRSEDTSMRSSYSWRVPCVYQTALLLSAPLFLFVFLVYQGGSFLVRFSSSSLRVACPCLRSRQVVLGCAHSHTYNASHKIALRKPATASTRPLGNISRSASFLLVSLEWHSGSSPCCRATGDEATQI